ncbi:hypothetical protein RRG08_043784 [Elysia crispata]|uniref:Uncharacterized protein n=1 Tax=Elysia crispata TaxID=231223 RepID=A0AAE1D9V8_9GAST|nr:hypothetical protein RRG08_043784 [Elysia crispata]
MSYNYTSLTHSLLSCHTIILASGIRSAPDYVLSQSYVKPLEFVTLSVPTPSDHQYVTLFPHSTSPQHVTLSVPTPHVHQFLNRSTESTPP